MPQSAESLPQGALGLPDSGFAETYDVPKAVKMQLLDDEVRGVLLDGPSELDPVAADTVIYLGVSVDTESRQRAVDLRSKAAVLSTGPDAGGIHVEWAFEGPHDALPVDYDAAADIDGDVAMFTFRVDLKRQIAALSWEPGLIHTWILLWDRRSNPVVTRLRGREVRDPAVAEFLGHRPRPLQFIDVNPPQGELGAHYERLEPSPPIPDGIGISLAADRVTVGTNDARLMVYGSFRLSVPARWRPAKPQEPQDPDSKRPRGPRPTAIVPVGLVLTGDEYSVPLLVRLLVPSFNPVDEEAESPEVTGYFRVDLAQETNLPRFQTYAVRAVSGSVLTEPILMAWVDPELLDEDR